MGSNEWGSAEANGRRETHVLLFVIRALACSLEVFLHQTGTFGARYLGAQVAAAMGILFIFPIFGEGLDPTDLYAFFACFIVLCVVIKGRTDIRQQRGGDEPHSFYNGTPRFFGRMPEQTAKLGEPFMVWIAAATLAEISPLLASYLAIAGGGLFLSVTLSAAAERKRLMDLHDAYSEQRYVVEQWRAKNGQP